MSGNNLNSDCSENIELHTCRFNETEIHCKYSQLWSNLFKQVSFRKWGFLKTVSLIKDAKNHNSYYVWWPYFIGCSSSSFKENLPRLIKHCTIIHFYWCLEKNKKITKLCESFFSFNIFTKCSVINHLASNLIGCPDKFQSNCWKQEFQRNIRKRKR